jgi:hypothetical protein
MSEDFDNEAETGDLDSRYQAKDIQEIVNKELEIFKTLDYKYYDEESGVSEKVKIYLHLIPYELFVIRLLISKIFLLFVCIYREQISLLFNLDF